MQIVPSSLTIGQLFSSEREQFSIPAYQRRYAWKEKQLGELFDDINLLNSSDTHLLSTVLFLTDMYNPNMNFHELVDGQQRITSLSILLKVIKDSFEKLDAPEMAGKINSLLHCRDNKWNSSNKIVLGDLDNSDYVKIMNHNELDRITNENLLKAYLFFQRRIEKFEKDDLMMFYSKLIDNTKIIRLDVSRPKDAYKLFETINNRGLKLSPTDIIKNFILGNASMTDKETLQRVKQSWAEIIGKLDRINTDDFFRQFIVGTLQRKVSKSKLIDEFKIHYIKNVNEAELLRDYHLYGDINDADNNGSEINLEKELSNNDVKKISIIEFSQALSNAAIIYEKIFFASFDSNKINKHLSNLSRIESTPSYTFLLNIFLRKLEDSVIIEILKILETFMLRRHICASRTSELDDIFSKLVGIENDNLVEKVQIQLSKNLPSNDEFSLKFSQYNFRQHAERAKYILEQIEYNLIEDKGEYVLNSGKDVHLEHIIPQKIDTQKSITAYGDWLSYLGDDALKNHKEYVDRIGNFSLLAQELNISASNNPFLSKKKEYSKSNIELNKDLTKYSHFKYEQVEERSKEFARMALEIWNFTLGR